MTANMQYDFEKATDEVLKEVSEVGSYTRL